MSIKIRDFIQRRYECHMFNIETPSRTTWLDEDYSDDESCYGDDA